MTTNASAFNQVGQQGKHGWWIAFGGGRFTNGQTNFALGMGHAGQAVTKHQHVLALIAKVLGDHMREVSGFQAQHG